MTKICITLDKSFIDLYFNYFMIQVRVNNCAIMLKMANYGHILIIVLVCL